MYLSVWFTHVVFFSLSQDLQASTIQSIEPDEAPTMKSRHSKKRCVSDKLQLGRISSIINSSASNTSWLSQDREVSIDHLSIESTPITFGVHTMRQSTLNVQY